MKCMNCGTNDAEHQFMVNWMGNPFRVNLCGECRTTLTKQYMGAMAQQYAGGQDQPSNRWPFFGQIKRRAMGENPFPADAGRDVRHKRHINALRGRLKEAIEEEQYELAAQLRDELQQAEKEVNL